MGLVSLVARTFQKMQTASQRQATASTSWAEDIALSQQAWAKRPRPEERDPWWEKKRSELRGCMTKATFDAWLACATARRDNGTVILSVKSEQAAEWMKARMMPVLERVLGKVEIEVMQENRND